jgi:hypothetical protein
MDIHVLSETTSAPEHLFCENIDQSLIDGVFVKIKPWIKKSMLNYREYINAF